MGKAYTSTEPVSVIVHRIEPVQLFEDLDLALNSTVHVRVVRSHRVQSTHLFPHGGQIALLEGDDIAPIVEPAPLEKALVGV